MGRKQAREGTMQLLFQMDVNEDYSDEVLDLYLDNFEFDNLETKYIIDAINSIKENLEVIDTHIANHLEGWDLDRLAKVDLSTLRIAIYEILYREDIPIEVSINEAVETVKKFSNEDSFKFVNGVLGSFVRTIEKE